MSATPKSSVGWVKALLHSVFDQPDAVAVHAQFDRVVYALAEKLPPWATTSRKPPDRTSIIRLVGEVLAEQRDERAEGCRYLGRDVLARSQAVDTAAQEVTDELTLQAITA